jgi:hypothetical protein
VLELWREAHTQIRIIDVPESTGLIRGNKVNVGVARTVAIEGTTLNKAWDTTIAIALIIALRIALGIALRMAEIITEIADTFKNDNIDVNTSGTLKIAVTNHKRYKPLIQQFNECPL